VAEALPWILSRKGVRQFIHYLDDFCGCTSSAGEAADSLRVFRETSTTLGLLVNEKIGGERRAGHASYLPLRTFGTGAGDRSRHSHFQFLGDMWHWCRRAAYNYFRSIRNEMEASEVNRVMSAYVGTERTSVDLVPAVSPLQP